MTRDTPKPTLSIGELAERAEVSRRTIRFYVQRGLIAPPQGGGRGAHYTEEHLERLLAVKRLQEVGIPLEVIQQRLGPLEAPP
ncbi:MAG TPA: MerR family transcriptional regulator, partial [Myxococcota bacterium]|nr:MerR family transcriptional regulator [Myxococcota bacterium]